MAPLARAGAAETALWVVALAGIASGIGLFLAHGLDVDGVPGFSWMAAIALLTAALIAGVLVRHDNPMLSTALIFVGAATPIVAWYHLWYWYPLAFAIAALAIATMPRLHRTSPA